MAERGAGAVRHLPERQRENRTGLPDQLKIGIETLSGLSLDDVRVSYNSAKPAALQASAYARGTEIHVAPGQERHLPHEAWHVVQQAQGRVRPTMRATGMDINNDVRLEHEADVMGAKGARMLVADSLQSNQVAQLHATSGNHASGSAGHTDVIQANGSTKDVAGTEVTFTPGYASWDQDNDSWHVNWRLGEKDVYHVTKESEGKIHYFFTVKAGEVYDATAPKGMKGRKGTSRKFSALPQSVQGFVSANISALMAL